MQLEKDGRSAPYRIVPAARHHLGAVPRLEQAAASIFPPEDLPAELRYLVTDHETLREAQKEGRIWVALDPIGDPVGFALADVLDGEAHLDEVDVHPLHARRGIGTRLVETVIDWAESRHFSSLSLLTFRHLPWNARFYEKFGFVPLAENELGPALSEILEQEAHAGIAIANRVGMRCSLPRPETCIPRQLIRK
jgi:GNAT superfamily N-acetyltransferase